MRFTSLLVGVGDNPPAGPSQEGRGRQPTPRPSPSQEGRNGNERGGRSKNCPKIVLPNYAPKILIF
ncbi:MAG: hypothetical protein F6K48_31660 [Okeania sp. SIO3H1]|nr:hypothetical protein [Okeania sp. SIO3H1]